MVDSLNRLISPADYFMFLSLAFSLQRPQVLQLSPKHTSSSSSSSGSFKPLSSRLSLSLSLKGHRDAILPQESQFLANQREYLERWLVTAMKCPPGARETFSFECERHQNNESCVVAKWEFTHVGLLRWWKWEASTPWIGWQGPLESERPLFINLLLTSQRWADVRCRGAVCFISLQSAPTPSQPTALLLLFFSLFFFLVLSPFQARSKGLRKHMQRWRENKSSDSCLHVWFFILSLAFFSPISQRLMYTLNKPVFFFFWQSKVERKRT